MDFRTMIKEYAEAPISRHLILELLSDYQSPNWIHRSKLTPFPEA